jgi:hypothetical protein
MAEFGFLGVVVNTRVHTPRFCGHFSSAGDLLLSFFAARPFLTSWFTVGKTLLLDTSNYLFRKFGQNPSKRMLRF